MIPPPDQRRSAAGTGLVHETNCRRQRRRRSDVVLVAATTGGLGSTPTRRGDGLSVVSALINNWNWPATRRKLQTSTATAAGDVVLVAATTGPLVLHAARKRGRNYQLIAGSNPARISADQRRGLVLVFETNCRRQRRRPQRRSVVAQLQEAFGSTRYSEEGTGAISWYQH